MGPRDRVVKGGVILGNQSIGLRAAAGEGVLHHNVRSVQYAACGLIFLSKKNAEFIDEGGRKGGGLAVEERIFAMAEIPCGLAQCRSADSLVLHVLVLGFKTEADRILLSELLRDARGRDGIALRVGDV